MKKIFLLIISFIFFSQICSASPKHSPKIDSLYSKLTDAGREDSLRILKLIGDLQFTEEDYTKALDSYFLGLTLAIDNRNYEDEAYLNNTIGRIYYEIAKYDQSMIYFNKALQNYRTLNNETAEGGALNNIALIYYVIDSLDKALEFYFEALQIKEKSDNKSDIAAIYHNIGLVYSYKNDYEKSIEYLEKALVIFQETGNIKNEINTSNNLSRYYIKEKQYKKAFEYLKLGLEKAKKHGFGYLIMDNYKYQSYLYKEKGLIDSAFKYQEMRYLMKDSLFNRESENQIAEIQTKYESELLKKENEAQVQKQKTVELAATVIIILLLAFLILYGRSNSQIRAANKQLSNQKKEIEAKNQQLMWLNEEITKQNKAIKKQKQDLESLNNIKDRLFSIISHEFKSPLNSLKGTLSLIHSGILSGQEIDKISKELSNKINNTSIFLDNLLNWAKSQMNGIVPKPTKIDLRKIAEENIKLLQSIAEKKEIEVRNHIDEPLYCFADENMVYLVLRNLISNSIKFSLKGGLIQVMYEKNDEFVTIRVKDNGIGMSADSHSKLFELHPIITPGTANEKGTGLGLYIARNFIESNGGKIWAESKPEKGSTFYFTIPRR